DAVRFRRRPPKLVVVDIPTPHFGTELGGSTGCSFPRFTWKPSGGDLDRDYAYPIVLIVQAEYREVFRARNSVVLEHRCPPSVTAFATSGVGKCPAEGESAGRAGLPERQ